MEAKVRKLALCNCAGTERIKCDWPPPADSSFAWANNIRLHLPWKFCKREEEARGRMFYCPLARSLLSAAPALCCATCAPAFAPPQPSDLGACLKLLCTLQWSQRGVALARRLLLEKRSRGGGQRARTIDDFARSGQCERATNRHLPNSPQPVSLEWAVRLAEAISAERQPRWAAHGCRCA